MKRHPILLLPAFWSLVLLPFLLTAPSAAGDHVTAAHEPTPNLGQWKTHLIAYHDCQESRGCYTADLNRQSDRAIAYLRQRTAKATPGDKLALVLDIDETALSNWDEEIQDDFGYIAKDWNDWVDKKAPLPFQPRSASIRKRASTESRFSLLRDGLCRRKSRHQKI